MGAFLQKALNGILSRIASSLSLRRLNKPLTELFLELKTDTTPAIVERIVNDIDEIVRVVRFDGWQNSTVGEREVKRELRKVLWTKYQIKDEDLFNKAYDYIKEYY